MLSQVYMYVWLCICVPVYYGFDVSSATSNSVSIMESYHKELVVCYKQQKNENISW